MGPGKRGNAEDVSKLKVAELKARLEELGESTKGKKAELVARLEQALEHMTGENAQIVEEPAGEPVGEPGAAAAEAAQAAKAMEKPEPRKAQVAPPVAKQAETTKKLTASQRMNLKKKQRKQKQRDARNVGKAEEGGRENGKAGAPSKVKGKEQRAVTYATEETRLPPELNMSEEVCVWHDDSFSSLVLDSRSAVSLRGQTPTHALERSYDRNS